MKNLRIILPFVAGLIAVFVTYSAVRAYEAPEPYYPPHPYPEPGWEEFPEPGDTIRYYMNGQTVDDIRAEIMYLHGSDFKNAMKQIRLDAAKVRQEQLQTNAAWEQAFPQVKQYALLMVEHIKCKLNEKIEKLETEAAEMAEYDIPTDGHEVAIDYINNVVFPLLENPDNPNDPATLKGQINNSKSTAEIKQVIQNTQATIFANEKEYRGVMAKVMSSRIQRFEYCVQVLVDFGNDIVIAVIDQLNATSDEDFPAEEFSKGLSDYYGRDIEITRTSLIEKYQLYVTNEDSRFNDDWARASAHYDKASEILWDCDGNDVCVEAAKAEMQQAKYLLQDMFHVFYWAYDWYKYSIEMGWKPSSNLIEQFMAEGLPDMPCQWMQMAGCHSEDPNDVCDADDAPEWWPDLTACPKPKAAASRTTPRGGGR